METEFEKDILTIYEDVKVYDYAYKAFHKLRHMDGITKEMIISSFNPDDNLKSALKAGESAGNSFMLNIQNYFDHMENGKSLLGRIYGLYQV
jgi:hypothetical protein